MAHITDMAGLVSGETGHITAATGNIPMSKNVAGEEVAAISYGTASCEGTDGSILVQTITGYEQVENIAPSIYQRINVFGGDGYSDWLKIG
jgi:hypothetical protein